MRRVERALISVSDKAGVAEFGKGLAAQGVTLYSTGGTARTLKEAGLAVLDVSALTEYPEMMDGRVKTLHPRVHGGILAIRGNAEHETAMEENGIVSIDLVCVNLYPFKQTVAKEGVSPEEVIEQIDIGGPSMVRSAAKNHAFVTIVTSPAQYDTVLSEMNDNEGVVSDATRRRFASDAFHHTADYDAAIARWFSTLDGAPEWQNPRPASWDLLQTLRYGENPHQSAALYGNPNPARPGVPQAEQLNGKALSYNNLLDCDAAWRLVAEFERPAAVVIKHTNPCGAACAEDLKTAWDRALAGDPVSAFGSIVACNRQVDAATAEAMAGPNTFLEAVLAPGFDDDALEILTTKPKWGKNVRLLRVPLESGAGETEIRAIIGGFLVQDEDRNSEDGWDVACGDVSDAAERDLRFAWLICKHVKSNAIVIVKDEQLVGAGAGQMSRVDAAQIAVANAGDRAEGGVAASDAFFPFPDGVEVLTKGGVAAVIQPGGSRKDADVVSFCSDAGVAMVMTGVRHFRH